VAGKIWGPDPCIPAPMGSLLWKNCAGHMWNRVLPPGGRARLMLQVTRQSMPLYG
jgi:hypothetical protein